MCATCGCTPDHPAQHHHHEHEHDHAPRLEHVERDLLEWNDGLAGVNRSRLAAAGQLCLNLLSSPGSGKTTLLVETLRRVRERYPVAVVEGDQRTERDALRIRETGTAAVQVNTGKGCHLDAHLVAHALDRLEAPAGAVVFVENVGNLVCPAAFDLGERHRVVCFSVTEGEDKPLKYPDMFASADLLLMTKSDLLAHVPFDLEQALGHARAVNPGIEALTLSALSGEGMDGWVDWLDRARAAASAPDAG